MQYLKFERLKVKYETLGENMKNTPEGRLIEQRYALLGKVKSGKQAPNFTLNSLDGTPVSLYDLEGKIKIVDFWASWCGPCRRENPHLIELYKRYKEKGLVILSVTIDTDLESWEKAIKFDGMEWLHVCDTNEKGESVARKYNVTAIPHIFVLDSSNKIIAENVRGKELEKVVKENLE